MKNKKYYIYCLLLIIIIVVFVAINSSFSVLYETTQEVEPNSPLFYYLDVKYDGVDKYGVESNSSRLVHLQSNEILVTDKLPVGLSFAGFVETSDGTIGSVNENTLKPCLGEVVYEESEEFTNYHGLHYNPVDHSVSFKVKDLRAGCRLTVGIKTVTPERKNYIQNFINKAEASEGRGNRIESNEVKAFITANEGTTVNTYKVKYQYINDVPSDAPSLPDETMYASGEDVRVESKPKLEGYSFDGWNTSNENVEISNELFKMPSEEVIFTGSFSPLTKYRVSYQIDGIIPDNYQVPNYFEAYESSNVTIDSALKKDDIFNGYRFLGWENEDVEFVDNTFIMPSFDVVLIGRFEKVKYYVNYEFYNNIEFSGMNNYLPSREEYYDGDTVVLYDVLGEPEGYSFVGWTSTDVELVNSSFTMPEKDVYVYGTWEKIPIKYNLSISSEVVSDDEYYEPGIMVLSKVYITNNNNFDVTDVYIRSNLSSFILEDNVSNYFEGVNISNQNNYELRNAHNAIIASLEAGETITLYAYYDPKKNDVGLITDVFSVIGATALDGYDLNSNIKSNINFKMKSLVRLNFISTYSNVKSYLTLKIKNSSNSFITSEIIKINNVSSNLNESIGADIVDTSNIRIKNSIYVFVKPNDSYIFNLLLPQQYYLNEITGDINNLNSSLSVEFGHSYNVNIKMNFVKKGYFHSFGRVRKKI